MLSTFVIRHAQLTECTIRVYKNVICVTRTPTGTKTIFPYAWCVVHACWASLSCSVYKKRASSVFHVGSRKMVGARPLPFPAENPPFFRSRRRRSRPFSHMSVFSVFCAFYIIYSVIKRFMTLFGVLYTILMLWAAI